MSDKVKIGALWKKEDKEGNKWLSGKMGDAYLEVSKNQFKKEDKQPDFIVYVAKPKKAENRSEENSPDQKAWD